MGKKIQQLKPDYKRIYHDILSDEYPERIDEFKNILEKPILSFLDMLQLNQKIFGKVDKSIETFNQRHRSYSANDIFEILDYQKNNNLNNVQLANHFKLSRNTITKWKKMFRS
ncbi:helix-turn-helix domain-containing protein [Chryseobacterium lathyri]|uniref:Transposase n=1 Tax=Chryseobacterium lathyri TaxID=395933 RepID=A0ABT9SS26_9FLAO|nr:helix-turn-helix domain-containing protein [Chryseobacterium lathyri]MDP9962253.1 hypothetical protein [Chryseobacterium lathyri]MDQ0068204.1 hypothetical protein [Chryseobacterium lathyri]